MHNEEIVIEEHVQGAPQVQGLGLGDIIRFAPLLQKLVELLTAGEGGFDVKFKGIRKHVQITNL